MKIYLYVKTEGTGCWVINSITREEYTQITLHTVENLKNPTINICNKDNLDKALLLISLGLPHKEIEELLNDSN